MLIKAFLRNCSEFFFSVCLICYTKFVHLRLATDLAIKIENGTHLPLVVKLQPGFLVNFSTSCLLAAVVVGTPAEVAVHVGGTLVASAAAAEAEAPAVTVEGTVLAGVLVAAKLGGSADD